METSSTNKTLEFTQDELKAMAQILHQLNFKLADCKILMPLAEKLVANIIPDKQPEEPVKLPNAN